MLKNISIFGNLVQIESRMGKGINGMLKSSVNATSKISFFYHLTHTEYLNKNDR